MDITVTGRHLTITPAIEEYARKRVSGIHIDFPRILNAHFILEVDKFRQVAEIVLHCGNHITIEARDVHEDLYAAIDRAVDKAERQIRKYKTRIQDHRPRRAKLQHFNEQVFSHDLEAAVSQSNHIRTEQYPCKPMFVDEAVLQLEVSDKRDFVVFLNAETEKLNVLYRHRNGDFGLIDPTLA
ncbi:MAG: ribosome-associated translation inhibitor RaiA [Verrucomicrobiota bacterium]